MTLGRRCRRLLRVSYLWILLVLLLQIWVSWMHHLNHDDSIASIVSSAWWIGVRPSHEAVSNISEFVYKRRIPLAERMSFLQHKSTSKQCRSWSLRKPKEVQERCDKVKCFVHPTDNLDDPVREQVEEYLNKNNNSQSDAPCKLLVFAGMHLGAKSSECGGEGGGYRSLYAANLMSILEHGKETLHPVIVLSAHGMNGTSHDAYAEWLRQQGATVIVLDKPLSFQSYITNHPGDWGMQLGIYIRMDLPRIIRQHGLFDNDNICPNHILYTDTDCLFVNNVTHQDIRALRARLQRNPDAVLSYGRQDHTRPYVRNNGVVLMDVWRFEQELPAMLEFSKTLTTPTWTVQVLWNQYFESTTERRRKVDILPLHWNWKAYWRLEPSVWQRDVKVLHFHGPKPGDKLWETATCDVDHVLERSRNRQYFHLSQQAICCDGARSSTRAWQMYHSYLPPPHVRNATMC